MHWLHGSPPAKSVDLVKRPTTSTAQRGFSRSTRGSRQEASSFGPQNHPPSESRPPGPSAPREMREDAARQRPRGPRGVQGLRRGRRGPTDCPPPPAPLPGSSGGLRARSAWFGGSWESTQVGSDHGFHFMTGVTGVIVFLIIVVINYLATVCGLRIHSRNLNMFMGHVSKGLGLVKSTQNMSSV